MEELYAKFLPQFTQLAKDRMQRAYEAFKDARPDAPTLTNVMRDLHSIAGEAGLLGLSALVPLARTAEEHAKKLRDGPATEAEAETGAFIGALDELMRALDAVGGGKPKAGA
jgi:two-component system chemotaxis sensor kinase CheA